MNTPFSALRHDAGSIRIHDAAKPVRRILAVDDDQTIRQLCADALINSGYQVDTAEDGAAGWQALHTNSYDLLLTDNKMPKVSGVELVRKLRAARMDLPVVLATGLIPTEDIDGDPLLQLAATLLKPFTIAVLLDTVEKALREAAFARERAAIPLPASASGLRQFAPPSPGEFTL